MEKYCSTKLTEEFLSITKELFNTFTKKNHDYGNSFFISLDKRGLAAALTRMEDKFNRLDTLVSQDKKALVDESIQDSLLDLANYAIMSVIWQRINSSKAGSDFDIDKKKWWESFSIQYKNKNNHLNTNPAKNQSNSVPFTGVIPEVHTNFSHSYQELVDLLNKYENKNNKENKDTVTIGVLNLTAHKMDTLTVEKSILKEYDCAMNHIKQSLGYNNDDVIDYTIIS